MVGESLILYWIHNSQDGSYEKHAQLELNVDGRITTQTIQNTKSDDDQGKASTYSINTGVYTEGTTIKWRVRTSGITEAYSCLLYTSENWKRTYRYGRRPSRIVSCNEDY